MHKRSQSSVAREGSYGSLGRYDPLALAARALEHGGWYFAAGNGAGGPTKLGTETPGPVRNDGLESRLA